MSYADPHTPVGSAKQDQLTAHHWDPQMADYSGNRKGSATPGCLAVWEDKIQVGLVVQDR